MPYAVKIFDDPDQTGQLQVLKSIPPDFGLEIAIYRKGKFIPEISQLIKNWQAPVIMHVSHKENSLEYQNPDYWEEEIKLAVEHEVYDFVLHVSPSSKKTELLPEIAQKLANLLQLRYPYFKFYLENTYEDLRWWEEFFFTGTLANNIGFTFDMGHTRALVPSALSNWLGFLNRLANTNRPLHFHLHCNPGDKDRHEPLFVGEYLGWYEQDGWLAQPIEFYLSEFNKLPGLKTLESKLKYTQGNILWLQQKGLLNNVGIR